MMTTATTTQTTTLTPWSVFTLTDELISSHSNVQEANEVVCDRLVTQGGCVYVKDDRPGIAYPFTLWRRSVMAREFTGSMARTLAELKLIYKKG